jgi:hypothetical protein
MKKMTALLTALFALAMVTGPAIAAETMEGSTAPMATGSLTEDLRNQLSPNVFGYIADGVADDEFRGPIDIHYGVAPAWDDGTEVTIEKELRGQLSPNVSGYIADGVADEEFRGPIDTHYGVAPAWEDRTEDPLERELRKKLSPNVHVDETSAF